MPGHLLLHALGWVRPCEVVRCLACCRRFDKLFLRGASLKAGGGRKPSRGCAGLRDRRQQLGWPDPEAPGDLDEHVERRVADSAF